MKLIDLVQRSLPASPWQEGDNIPWNEPAFSQRMLKEHLSQSHDAASRRSSTIDQQVAWIHNYLLAQKPTNVLDLACGPGLYTARLARLGHTCYGIDYSPASIDYASSIASQDDLNCTYLCQDIRQAEFPSGIGLVMLIFGEFNVFRPRHVRNILEKSWYSLVPGGLLLLEPHPYQVVYNMGQQPSSWYSSSAGIFSDSPHLVLQENFWDASMHTTTIRYFVIDAASSEITRHAQTFQAYQDEEYQELLASCGFGDIQFFPNLKGDDSQENLIAIHARKPLTSNDL